MVVIVIDTVLVTSSGADGLDTTDETSVQKDGQGVVNGLARNGPDLHPGDVSDAFGGDVWVLRDGSQYGKSLSGGQHAALSKNVREALGHAIDNIKFWSKSRLFVRRQNFLDRTQLCQPVRVARLNYNRR